MRYAKIVRALEVRFVSFSRTSFFGVSSVSSLVFFRFVFVAGRAAGAPRNHCGARRDDGETPGAGLKSYSSFSFPVNPKPFVILRLKRFLLFSLFCCFSLFFVILVIKLVLQDALVPYFLRLKKQLAMARYFSAFAFLPFAQSSVQLS